MKTLRTWFPKLESVKDAKDASKQGLYGILAFAAMNLLGVFFAIYFNKSPSDQSLLDTQGVQDQMIGGFIVLPIILIAAYRVYSGKGWIAGGFILVWFLIEVTVKVVSGTTSFGWIICYAAIAMMIINGIRGCWWIRASKSNSETLMTDEKTAG